MAVTADKVVVELELRDGQYLSRVRQNERVFSDAQRRTANSAEQAERRIRASSDRIGSAFRSLAVTLAAGFSARAVVQLADEYTTLQNRLQVVGLAGDSLASVQDRLYEAGNRNGVAVADLAQLYSRVALSAGELGASQEQLLSLTDGVTAALRVQGVSAQAASGPLLQLGQALGAGVVRAEEYNSIIEGVPVLAQAAARGLTETGVSVAELRKRVIEGTVSSQEFFQALLKGLPEVERQAEASALTIGQSLTVLNNELGRFIGETDQSLSASQRMSQAIISLSENLDRIVPVLATLVTFFGTRLALSMGVSAVAALRATHMATGLSAALVNMAGGPVGIAITAVAALSAAIVYLGDRMKIQGEVTEDAALANTALKTATDAYAEAARAAAIASGQDAAAKKIAAEEARKQAAAERDNAKAKLASAQATIALIQAEAARMNNAERFNIRGDRPGSVQTIGRERRQELADAQATATASAAAIATANAAISAADAAIDARPASSSADGTTTPGSSSSAASGPTAAELAAMREELRLQGELALAQSRGDEVEARRIQRLIDINNLTEQYVRAQASGARELATAQIDAVAANEEISRQVDQLERDGENRTRRRLEGERAVREEQMRQLEFEIEISRLSRDSEKTKDLERQLALLQRIAEYGPGREGEAQRDQDRLNTARDESEIMTEYQTAARSFVEVLSADNVWESLGQKFAKAAEDNLTNVIADLFAILGKNNTGGFGDLFRLGSSFFGGGRARGGPVRAGFSYDVGENGREKFIAPANGYIMPNMNAAAASPQSSMVRLMVDESAMFAVRVQEISGPIAVQAASTAYNRAYEDIPRSQARRSRQRLG